MKDIERYLRILRLIRAGKSDEIGTDDYKFFSQFSFDVDNQSIEKLKNEAEFKNMSKEDISRAMQQSFLAAVQNPQYRDQMLLAAKDLEKKETADKITTALNLALGGADILSSTSQIRQANKRQQRLRRPVHPAPLTADPALDRAMIDASQPGVAAERAIAPSKAQILDQYLSDLDTARTVSGGQAGVYGSLAQNASTRRGRRALELAPIYDEVSRRGEQRYDQLLAQRLQQNKDIQQSRSQYFPYDQQQYQIDQENINQRDAAGRYNLRSSVGAVTSFLPQFLSELQTRKRFRDIYNKGLIYGEDNAKTMAEADRNIFNPPSRNIDLEETMLNEIYNNR